MRRRSVVAALSVLVVAGLAGAANQVVIEDWKAYNVGTTGLPGEWKPSMNAPCAWVISASRASGSNVRSASDSSG